jgi:uncharacterized membrane protein YedE/YeeE
MLELIKQPWPWYIAGPLIGLTVPALLIIGNKTFGISSSLRHTCAACFPSGIKFFTYNWKKEIWNMMFVLGIFIGGIIATFALANPGEMQVAESTMEDLSAFGITNSGDLMPAELFNWEDLLSLKGILMFVVGGFLVGFGTRWAGGCTSGHAIMGLSNLQWPSLVATIFFMIGGFLSTHFILPLILNL